MLCLFQLNQAKQNRKNGFFANTPMSEEKDRKIVSHSCNLNGNCALFTSVICNSDLYFESFGVFTCLYSTALCMSIPFDMPHLTLSVDKKMYALFIYCTHCDCWWDVSGGKNITPFRFGWNSKMSASVIRFIRNVDSKIAFS